MEKTGIFIIVYNTDRFLSKQLELIKEYCTDDKYVIYVINNSPVSAGEVNDKIEYQANRAGAIYLKTIPDAKHSDPSRSHAGACNFIYREIGRSMDYCLFLDHDIFPLKQFSVREKLKNRMMAGVEEMRLSSEKKVQYLWLGLLFINNNSMSEENKNMVSFMPTSKYGVALDTGGELHELISKNNIEKNFIFLDKKRGDNAVFNKNRYSYYSVIDDESWMHFINGSNWLIWKMKTSD